MQLLEACARGKPDAGQPPASTHRMRGTLMRLLLAIGTAVLSLTIVAPVYAQQEQHDQQEEEKAKPAQDEKKAQPDRKQEEKSAQQEKSARPEEKNSKPEEKNARQEQQRTPEAKPERQEQHASAAAFLTTATKPTLDANTVFGLAKAITAITAFNTAAIGSDSPVCGRATGSTRKTFMWSTLTACITCVTPCTQA